jgi:hypothetical protein
MIAFSPDLVGIYILLWNTQNVQALFLLSTKTLPNSVLVNVLRNPSIATVQVVPGSVVLMRIQPPSMGYKKHLLLAFQPS